MGEKAKEFVRSNIVRYLLGRAIEYGIIVFGLVLYSDQLKKFGDKFLNCFGSGACRIAADQSLLWLGQIGGRVPGSERGLDALEDFIARYAYQRPILQFVALVTVVVLVEGIHWNRNR